ncbi:ubiquinone oxidoreductase 20 kd subunit [Fimicolochytrium jonesii]|uniref:ubiquinone oxidoreductase 20 kd subunit n=1 Tax=Fimicolochytrium jonesii TaxID=1396493 RepID=UPI0022FE0379|nr:ubiquinone oxidoreductase 20 kd subunit [Fimicolochytrium jonesii]KAI8823373.1 ubiquinone oxidoreductase 20 kd subunit [Fimicolochytrium jonesii]
MQFLRASHRVTAAGLRRMSTSAALQAKPPLAAASVSITQAPNRAAKWSEHQQDKSAAMVGPRFEQTDLSLQPNPLSAQDLISKVPVKFVQARRVSCDGGGGALGHPKVYLNLDKNEPQACGYCGLQFQQEHHHH